MILHVQQGLRDEGVVVGLSQLSAAGSGWRAARCTTRR